MQFQCGCLNNSSQNVLLESNQKYQVCIKSENVIFVIFIYNLHVNLLVCYVSFIQFSSNYLHIIVKS